MPASSAPARFDVLGIGNAIVDVLARAEDALLADLGLVKGAMTLIDEARVEELYRRMGPAREVSGGSAANTIAAVASLGGSSAYIGRVRDDQLGAVFAHDIRATGVTFENPPVSEGPATARSLIFVTPDAQRTMQTYLGACVDLAPEDVDEKLVAAAEITYLEGYLWDKPRAKEAVLKAADVAKKAGRRLALTLSDSFCVDRWREEFLDLVHNRIDILFANEAEITSLYQVPDFETALAEVRGRVGCAALTRGARGSVVLKGDEQHAIAAVPPENLVDTTGAGDLYAAGFLRGLTAGLDLRRAGELASASAAAILGQYGPRADRPLQPLFARIAAS